MADYVIPPPPQASLPVGTGGQHFPIRRVFCVGRNYAATRAKWVRIPLVSRRSSS
jgi:hypothetical protein